MNAQLELLVKAAEVNNELALNIVRLGDGVDSDLRDAAVAYLKVVMRQAAQGAELMAKAAQ